MELRNRVLSLTLLALLPATAWAETQAASSARPLRLELDATHVERPARIARAARRAPDFLPPPSVGRRAVDEEEQHLAGTTRQAEAAG